jgi:hypothetical protein
MDAHQLRIRQRRSEKLALSGLSLVLAVVLSALGCGFLFMPLIAEGLAHDGYGPGLRYLLGAIHLAGGIALLVSRLAEKAALVLGLFVSGVPAYLLWVGEGSVTGGPALMAFALLLLGASLRLRHRDDVTAWHEMLARYADHEDSRRKARRR